LLHYNKQN